MKSRIEVVDFPVFTDYTVHIEVATDLGQAMKKYPSTACIDDDLEHTDGVTVRVHSECMSFIFFKPHASPGTVAHECFHAVRNMLNFVGVDLDSETVAYHLGYLVNKASKLVRKK